MKIQEVRDLPAQEYYCNSCQEFFFQVDGLSPVCPKCGTQDSQWLQEVGTDDEDDYPAGSA